MYARVYVYVYLRLEQVRRQGCGLGRGARRAHRARHSASLDGRMPHDLELQQAVVSLHLLT